MPETSVDFFIKDPAVTACIKELEDLFGPGGEKLLVSDVIDGDGHQYVHLVQKGGGVLGVALIGYTYVLEQMNIRFVRLAGTSAGAINTALMTVIGGTATSTTVDGVTTRTVTGDKKKAKSTEILAVLNKLNFFRLVDGHPIAQWLIKNFISNKGFVAEVSRWATAILVSFGLLLFLDFSFLGLQYKWPVAALLAKLSFILTGALILVIALLVTCLLYLFNRLKSAGFGVNPGNFFFNWVKEQMEANDVLSVADLISKSSSPVKDIALRVPSTEGTNGLDGDVTFITSELVSQNKIEFPRMWNLFRNDMNQLDPAGFVRASMSIPVFFESYFISEIPCHDEKIKEAWAALGESDPPSTARFVDGGVLSNFPINLFYNPNVTVPRLPTFGIDLDDTVSAKDAPKKVSNINQASPAISEEDAGKDAEAWSFGGYIYRLFNTVRFYYDKDFLIKNAFYRTGIGSIPLKEYNWLNFFMDDNTKKEMFILGARTATEFLKKFDWETYKEARTQMQESLKKN